ncbi:MAG: YafY family transcriptional regulator [Flavobacterium sp.]|uniref:helix-turn-helix transcriptional regulator n=1 Tax=Flavobacterium sp. TaxID=239 RepID=UPI00120402F8|nr:YafY family protein [Flavobacterium sp.]RZJ67803.1 MAG: YafY family transcriptional regulator [Flavobacterium sp.]
MTDNDTKRVSRLTAILIQLQSKSLLTAQFLADEFNVSTRTIYRDIRALEKAGVPIVTEEGRGYTLMDGYRIPPIMFSENEANAIMTAQLLVMASKDQSLIDGFRSATQKIKAVLPNRLKKRIENLEHKVAITKFYTENGAKSQNLLHIQKALIEHIVIKIQYTNAANESSTRELEPFALYSNSNDEWVLIAFCRSRDDFRSFSLKRIESLSYTDQNFVPQNVTFEHYLKKIYGNE